MSPWFLLVIPFIAIGISIYFYSHKVIWWELLLLLAIPALFILIFKTITVSSLNSATEYRGSYIVEARYYEYWETWVKKTCSYTTCTGGKVKTCVTHYYDCSYCDKNPAKYTVVDNYGEEFTIQKSDYLYLIKSWRAAPKFVELNREIDYNGSCGKDGNMYSIRWDGRWTTSLNIVNTNSYVNRVISAKSTFNYKEVSEKEMVKYGLYKYPQVFGLHRQQSILGLDSIYNGPYLNSIKKKFEFFNGYYGPRKHIKLFVLMFYNKPITAAKKQEQYWVGGNDNEVVVCIGVDKNTKKLQWVKTFSWSVNKRIIIDCREDIMENVYFDPFRTYRVIELSVISNFKPRNLDEDFKYLDAELPTWSLWFCAIATLIITVLLLNFFIHNEFD